MPVPSSPVLLVLLVEWVVSTAGYGKLTQCCCSELSSESRTGALSCGWVVTQWTSPHRSIVIVSITPGVWSQRPLPVAISDQWPDLWRDIETQQKIDYKQPQPKHDNYSKTKVLCLYYRRNIAFLSIFLSTDILIASVRRSRAYFDLLLCPNILLDIA